MCGSFRPEAQSKKIAEWILDRAEQLIPKVKSSLLDIKLIDMTFDPNEYWDGKSKPAKEMGKVYKKFKKADGFIIVTPEWGGGVPPALRQLILMSGTSMSHKPVLSVGVSATRLGGIRPVEELKHASKNTRLVFVPDPVIITNVESSFNEKYVDVSNEHEVYLSKKIDYSIKVFEQYAKALVGVRDSSVIDYKEFPNGM